MTKILTCLYGIVWGVPAVVLIAGAGVYLSICTGFVQVRFFPRALSEFFHRMLGKRKASGGISPYRALCTALAATVGTGNLVGVCGAISLGGPGAVFWIWVCGFLGMAVKYAEAALAVRYRTESGGEAVGGPMYMIVRGMGDRWRPLALVYSAFGMLACFGVGNMTQINSVVTSLNRAGAFWGIHPSLPGNFLLGLGLTLLVGAVLLGGARRIGAAAETLVPVAAGVYILTCILLLILRLDAIPGALFRIVQGAFSPRAVTGGMLGSAFCVLRIGCSRGIFTNEAGMGTAAIAHASAEVSHPAEQGLMGIIEVFLDTIVICTLTALAVLCSGAEIPYGTDAGALLADCAFSAVLGEWVCILLAVLLSCFAFATVLGWGMYGARCAQFLFGPAAFRAFAAAQTAVVLVGAVMKPQTVWRTAEVLNGLMMFPNLFAVLSLSPELVRLTKEYKELSIPG